MFRFQGVVQTSQVLRAHRVITATRCEPSTMGCPIEAKADVAGQPGISPWKPAAQINSWNVSNIDQHFERFGRCMVPSPPDLASIGD